MSSAPSHPSNDDEWYGKHWIWQTLELQNSHAEPSAILSVIRESPTGKFRDRLRSKVFSPHIHSFLRI